MNFLPILRVIALLEGLSYLALLFIGVPLKYFGENESLVKLLGMPHGILFVAYVVIALVVRVDEKWNFKNTLIILACSIIPLGTFWADYKFFRKQTSPK
tara:strand:+ start:866 stop:1162 length:297 start_codon:yes stop_codon:yes gene_type:complete